MSRERFPNVIVAAVNVDGKKPEIPWRFKLVEQLVERVSPFEIDKPVNCCDAIVARVRADKVAIFILVGLDHNAAPAFVLQQIEAIRVEFTVPSTELDTELLARTKQLHDSFDDAVFARLRRDVSLILKQRGFVLKKAIHF